MNLSYKIYIYTILLYTYIYMQIAIITDIEWHLKGDWHRVILGNEKEWVSDKGTHEL